MPSRSRSSSRTLCAVASARIGFGRGASGAVIALITLGLAGCGNVRVPVPNLSQPVAPGGFDPLHYSGVGLQGPREWTLSAHAAPLLVTISSGPAVIALWRYPGAATPPAGIAELTAARTALVSSARARDPGFDVIRSGLLSIDGRGAVELDALERIDGRLRRVRSTHVYVPGGEVVLEEYAPPELFSAVDHSVFSPVRRSLRLLTSAGA